MSDGPRRGVFDVDEDRALDALALAWVLLTRSMSSAASGRRSRRQGLPGRVCYRTRHAW